MYIVYIAKDYIDGCYYIMYIYIVRERQIYLCNTHKNDLLNYYYKCCVLFIRQIRSRVGKFKGGLRFGHEQDYYFILFYFFI